MSALHQYLDAHAHPVAEASADTVDLVFFKLQPKGGDAATLKALMSDHPGEFCDVDPFDGQEHSYLELGGWLGSQDYALRLMGLGTALGLWKLLSPYTVLGPNTPPELAQMMAGQGLLSVMAQNGTAAR